MSRTFSMNRGSDESLNVIASDAAARQSARPMTTGVMVRPLTLRRPRRAAMERVHPVRLPSAGVVSRVRVTTRFHDRCP